MVRNRNRKLRWAAALLLGAAASLGLAACGGSDQASKLLRETFSGRHRITSGQLGMTLRVSPSGPSALNGPIVLSLAGPFQSLGGGKLPASAFTISLAAGGSGTALTVTSTGSTGYVTFQGQSYQLPQRTYQQLESSFAGLGTAPGSPGGGAAGRLGIHPQRWVSNPQIVGDQAIDGTNTTRIRAAINMPALLRDLSTFLRRAASAGVPGASGLLSAADRRRIASEVQHPTVDVWTGVADRTLRKLEIDLGVPVSGQLSALFGRSAAVTVTIEYADLNQPQTIIAPTKLLPYSQFQAKLRVLIQDLEGGLITGAGGAPTAGAGGSGPNYQAYTSCIQAANGDLAKMEKCAPLLSAK
jgi:hypothetical protein